MHDFQPQSDAAIAIIEAFLIWNANTFQFFILHEVKGLGPFPLLVQVNLVTSILQNEFVKNIPSPSSNCGGKYCHVFNTLKAFISSSGSSVNKAAFDLHLCKKMLSGVSLKND